eukprot:jgi/Mesvir1/20049/Mv13300-RA.1
MNQRMKEYASNAGKALAGALATAGGFFAFDKIAGAFGGGGSGSGSGDEEQKGSTAGGIITLVLFLIIIIVLAVVFYKFFASKKTPSQRWCEITRSTTCSHVSSPFPSKGRWYVLKAIAIARSVGVTSIFEGGGESSIGLG